MSVEICAILPHLHPKGTMYRSTDVILLFTLLAGVQSESILRTNVNEMLS